MNELDQKLMKQHPSNEFIRPPQSIQKHLRYWKASEFQNWALFNFLPLLLGILPPLYWHHVSVFICSLHILLKDNLHMNEIDAAKRMFWDFYNFTPELYGRNSCTHIMHLLSHIWKYVQKWGPLCTRSVFGFQNKNGQLKHDL